ncbi:hypothetical protein Droror1_Dr00009091 [Drosera rotundifolia]
MLKHDQSSLCHLYMMRSDKGSTLMWSLWYGNSLTIVLRHIGIVRDKEDESLYSGIPQTSIKLAINTNKKLTKQDAHWPTTNLFLMEIDSKTRSREQESKLAQQTRSRAKEIKLAQQNKKQQPRRTSWRLGFFSQQENETKMDRVMF